MSTTGSEELPPELTQGEPYDSRSYPQLVALRQAYQKHKDGVNLYPELTQTQHHQLAQQTERCLTRFKFYRERAHQYFAEWRQLDLLTFPASQSLGEGIDLLRENTPSLLPTFWPQLLAWAQGNKSSKLKTEERRNELLEEKKDLLAENARLTQELKDQLATANDQIAQLDRAAATKVQSLEGQKQNLLQQTREVSEELADWETNISEALGKIEYDGDAVQHLTLAEARAEIEKLRRNSDLSALRSLLPAVLQNNTFSPTLLASALRLQFASATMAPQGGSGRFSVTFSEGNSIATVWATIPSHLRRGRPQPTTSQEFNDFLNELLINNPPAAPTSCSHPSQLATQLGMDQDQDWDTSLGMVQDLLQAPGPAPTTFAPTRLFKPSDVPEFNDTKKYFEYRSTLRMFLLSEEDPAPGEYGRALLRILSTFKDDTARAAATGWDISPIIQPTWPATREAFLQALDQKFLSETILEETIQEFLRVYPKEADNATSFFNRFEAALSKRRAVESLRHVTPVSNETVTARLLSVLPRYLVENLRLDLARRGTIIETLDPSELRTQMGRTWAYVPAPLKPARTPIGARAAPASPTGGNQVTTRTCGLTVSYDSSPPVPQTLRGSLFPDSRQPANNPANAARRRLAVSMQVCQYCRRPRSQHQAVGTNFKAVTPETGVRLANQNPPPATIAAPTTQRLLPAPEEVD